MSQKTFAELSDLERLKLVLSAVAVGKRPIVSQGDGTWTVSVGAFRFVGKTIVQAEAINGTIYFSKGKKQRVGVMDFHVEDEGDNTFAIRPLLRDYHTYERCTRDPSFNLTELNTVARGVIILLSKKIKLSPPGKGG